MRQVDVMNAIADVEKFLQNNGTPQLYVRNNGYGVYVNWTVKSVVIHGPNSPDWRTAQGIRGTAPNIFNQTSNGFWIGHFDSFEKAYTFADLLRRILYIQTHEEMLLATGRDINNNPFRIF